MIKYINNENTERKEKYLHIYKTGAWRCDLVLESVADSVTSGGRKEKKTIYKTMPPLLPRPLYHYVVRKYDV